VVASAAEDATNNVRTVASAAEELSSSIAEISRQVATSNDVAKRGVNQAAKATDEIARQIAAVQGTTGSVVDGVGEIDRTITAISENATAIAAAVEQQTTAIDGINGKTQSLSESAQTVHGVVEQLAQRAGETGAQSQQVVQLGSGVSDTTGQLNDELDAYLMKIRQGGGNRREHPRVPMSETVQLEADGRSQSCRLVNLSATGALVTGAEVERNGQSVALSLSGQIYAARVVRFDDDGIGLQFTDDAAAQIARDFAGRLPIDNSQAA
jgi:methyl-accepting chemotaxis protein